MLKKLTLLLAGCAILCFAPLAQAQEEFSIETYMSCKTDGYSVNEDIKMDCWDIALQDYLMDKMDWEDINFYTLGFDLGESRPGIKSKKVVVFKRHRAHVMDLQEYLVSDNGEIAVKEGGTYKVVRAADPEFAHDFHVSDKGSTMERLAEIPESGIPTSAKRVKGPQYKYQLIRMNRGEAAYVNENVKQFDRTYRSGYDVTVFDEDGDVVTSMIVDDGVHNIYRCDELGWHHIYSDEPVG